MDKDVFFGSIEPFLPRSYEWYEDEPKGEEKLKFVGGEDLCGDLPLFDEHDKEILLHRDIHFGGSFGAMREYYMKKDAKGICEDIHPDRIAFLESVQKMCGRDLAPLILTGSDAERVAKARIFYKKLQEIAQTKPKTPESTLAECILSEDDIDNIILNPPELLLQKPEMLIPIISSEEFFDILSPGYGQAPLLAIELLGKLRYEGAIKPLFQLLGTVEEHFESAVLSSLHAIGEEAKNFGLKILQARPITRDTERAALMLTHFLPDADVQKAFVKELQDDQVKGILKEFLLIGLE